MLPIGLSLLSFLYKPRGEGTVPRRDFATALMLVTSFAASLGGLGTPVGTPTNLIGMGFLKEQLGLDVGFFQWAALAMPILILLLVWTVWTLSRGAPAGLKEIPGGQEFIEDERRSLGPLSIGEKNVLTVFAVTILLWILPGAMSLTSAFGSGAAGQVIGDRLPEGMVALLGAAALFILPTFSKDRRATLSWRDVERIDWGTVILLGSGMALGRLSDRTGLARAVGEALASALPTGSVFPILLASTVTAVLVSETTSNMASVTMLVPLVISISRGAGVDPVLPALGATLGGSLGFMLPVSTPPNALVYGSGYVPIPKMIRHGVLLDVMGVVVVVAVLSILGPVVLR
jgi:sodium-dependent dicarboxylate transporter 2/3/5